MSNSFNIDNSVTLSLSDDAKNRLIEIAISDIVSNHSAYIYSQTDYSWLVNDDSFLGLWNSYPKFRGGLTDLLIHSNSNQKYGVRVSENYASSFLKSLDKSLFDSKELEANLLRQKIVPQIYLNYDYKAEILRLQETECSDAIVNGWINVASLHSNSDDLYEFLLSRVKRAPGSTEVKTAILTKAFERNVICEEYIRQIAESSPINLRRAAVDGLVRIMSSLDYEISTIRYGYGYHYSFASTRNIDQSEKARLLELESKRERAESLALLFAHVEDRSITRNLAVQVSIKNLPWVLPAAAKFPWIVKEIQRRIDKGE
jgi:hypothetical protein